MSEYDFRYSQIKEQLTRIKWTQGHMVTLRPWFTLTRTQQTRFKRAWDKCRAFLLCAGFPDTIATDQLIVSLVSHAELLNTATFDAILSTLQDIECELYRQLPATIAGGAAIQLIMESIGSG